MSDRAQRILNGGDVGELLEGVSTSQSTRLAVQQLEFVIEDAKERANERQHEELVNQLDLLADLQGRSFIQRLENLLTFIQKEELA